MQTVTLYQGYIPHFNIKFIIQQILFKMATLKKTKFGFQDQISLNAGQKYCRMLQGEHSAIISTIIKLPFVIKIFVLSIFEWPLYTGFTVVFKLIVKSRYPTIVKITIKYLL